MTHTVHADPAPDAPPPMADHDALRLAVGLIAVDHSIRDGDFDVSDILPSVQKHGVLQPLVVRPSLEGYTLVAGGRRLKAARLAGLETVPVTVRAMDDAEALEVELLENLARRDLNPLEETRAILGYLHVLLADSEPYGRIGKPDWPPEQRVAALLMRMRKHAVTRDKEDDMRRGSNDADLVIATFERLGRRWRTFADVNVALMRYPEDVQALVGQEGISLDAVREMAQIKEPGLRAEAIEKLKAARAEKPGVSAQRLAREARGEVLSRASGQRKIRELAETMEKREAADREEPGGWRFPGDAWDEPRFADLGAPLWPSNTAGAGHPGEVDPLVYQRLLAHHTASGERVVSVSGGPSGLLEAATAMGRVARAFDPEPMRSAVDRADPGDLPLEHREVALAVLHLPAWGEPVLSERFGWGPETAMRDASGAASWDGYKSLASEAFLEARRVAERVAVVCRDVAREGSLRSIPAIIAVGFGDGLEAVHRWTDAEGNLWHAVVGRS